jgi:hypothetical protein
MEDTINKADTIHIGRPIIGVNAVIYKYIKKNMETASYTGEKKTKADPLLAEFVRFCFEHPDQRFWQALRNWSKVKAIFIEKKSECGSLMDTFYFEAKDN